MLWAIQCRDGSLDEIYGVPIMLKTNREAQDYIYSFGWESDRPVKVSLSLVPGQPKAKYVDWLTSHNKRVTARKARPKSPKATS